MQIPRKVWEKILEICNEGGFNVPETDEELHEFLVDADEVAEEDYSESRWWMSTIKVVRLKNLLVRFHNARTTGDRSPDDVGWSFDPSTIEVVKEVERTIVVKEYIPEENYDS
jgi:hypothetical protein